MRKQEAARLASVSLMLVGCHQWVPATSLVDIHDDTVRISTPDSTVTMEHATADGHDIEGTPVTEGGRFEVSEACAPPACHRIDVTSANVEVKRTDGAATAGLVVLLIAGGALSVLGTGMLVALGGMGGMK